MCVNGSSTLWVFIHYENNTGVDSWVGTRWRHYDKDNCIFFHDDYDPPNLIPFFKLFDLHMAHEMWHKRNCVDFRSNVLRIVINTRSTSGQWEVKAWHPSSYLFRVSLCYRSICICVSLFLLCRWFRPAVQVAGVASSWHYFSNRSIRGPLSYHLFGRSW